MRTKTIDRRTRRTRKQLHNALLSRIFEKTYESITVQEILDRADVGRSTFYTHFRNKDELLTCEFESFKASLESAEADAPEGQSYDWIVALSTAAFAHAAPYRNAHRALRGSQAGAVIQHNLRSVFFDVIGRRVALEMQRRGTRADDVTPELLTLFLTSTQMALLYWWLDKRNPMSAEAIGAAFGRLVLPALASIFEPRS